MKKIIILIIVIFVVLGLMSRVSSPESNMCTLRALKCQITGEYNANDCISSKTVFGFWVINIAKQCSGREIITCQDNNEISSRIDIDKDKCKYSLTFLQ